MLKLSNKDKLYIKEDCKCKLSNQENVLLLWYLQSYPERGLIPESPDPVFIPPIALLTKT